MPTYEYRCLKSGRIFEYRQAMTEEAITECPQCHGKVQRLISGGAGFIFKGSGQNQASRVHSGCSLEQLGKTCCGREERCEKPSCEE